MPARIRLLDDLTINKIAAGEVVENASSVVKELVENSLDAEATDICVEIGAGGRHLIRITDNGIGMGRDDALLSLERHATSKIRSIDDLNDLTSLGFRGEAIPSIASISRFSILTSDGMISTLLKVEGGKIITCETGARSKGTTVEVKDLFYNLPVRKKFLKSPASDETAIIKSLSEIAIARPDVKFTLIMNQETVFTLPIQEPEARILMTLGAAFKEELLPLNGIPLRGYIGSPLKGRPNRSAQYLFLNGRVIKSSFISWAIKEGYSTHLPERRFPLFVLWLTLPPQEVDVNVHPQKREVRFRDERALQELIFKGVREALFVRKNESLTPLMALPPKWECPLREEVALPQELSFTFENKHSQAGKLVAALKGYLLAEVAGQEGIQLIDQERAYARILFERLMKQTEKKTSQEPLLIPYTFELIKPDALLLKEHIAELNALGFEIREFGEDSFVLEAYPSAYGKVELEALVRLFLDDLKEYKLSRYPEEKLKSNLAERSAFYAFRERKTLTSREGQQLIDDLARCDEAECSPSGKPVRVQLDAKTLSKYF